MYNKAVVTYHVASGVGLPAILHVNVASVPRRHSAFFSFCVNSGGSVTNFVFMNKKFTTQQLKGSHCRLNNIRQRRLREFCKMANRMIKSNSTHNRYKVFQYIFSTFALNFFNDRLYSSVVVMEFTYRSNND